MPFCSNCGKEIENNAKFCSGCGSPQNATPLIIKDSERPNLKAKYINVHNAVKC